MLRQLGVIDKGNPAFALRDYKAHNKRLTQWPLAMATLSCVWSAIQGVPHRQVFTGDDGYRRITARRRAMNIPNTPGTDVIKSP
jgi:hypothetical protein